MAKLATLVEDFKDALVDPPWYVNGPVAAVTVVDGRLRVLSTGPRNLLGVDQATFEGAALTGWYDAASPANSTRARSTAQAAEGVASMAVTKTGSTGVMSTRTADGQTPGSLAVQPATMFPVVVGQQYTARAALRAATTGRSATVSIVWHDASGGYLSSSDGTPVTDTNTGQTVAFATASAPTGAVGAAVLPYWQSVPSGETHYIDAVGLGLGADTAFVAPVRVPGYYGVLATVDYDFAESGVYAQVFPLSPTLGHETLLRLIFSTVDRATMSLTAAGLKLTVTTNDVDSSTTVSWDVLYLWWQIREASGVVFFEVSLDGREWTTLASKPRTFSVATARPHLLVTSGATDPVTYALFGDVNVLPPRGTTDRLYALLPEVYRAEDLKHKKELLRYVSLAADQASEVEDVLDRAPAIADPVLADDAWLDWLAQLVGVTLSPALTTAQRRDAVRYASSGWRAGTTDAMADAARSELLNTKFVAIYDHSTDVSARGAAGQWDVLVVTRATETPSPAAVLAAIPAKNAKPAGVKLYYRTYDSSWDTVVATYTTWNAIEAAGTWDKVQEAGL